MLFRSSAARTKGPWWEKGSAETFSCSTISPRAAGEAEASNASRRCVVGKTRRMIFGKVGRTGATHANVSPQGHARLIRTPGHRNRILLRRFPSIEVSTWSAAGSRGYTGCLSSGKAAPNFVKKRVRCSRGSLPRIVGNSFRRFPLIPFRFPSSLQRGGAAPGPFASIRSSPHAERSRGPSREPASSV